MTLLTRVIGTLIAMTIGMNPVVKDTLAKVRRELMAQIMALEAYDKGYMREDERKAHAKLHKLLVDVVIAEQTLEKE